MARHGKAQAWLGAVIGAGASLLLLHTIGTFLVLVVSPGRYHRTLEVMIERIGWPLCIGVVLIGAVAGVIFIAWRET